MTDKAKETINQIHSLRVSLSLYFPDDFSIVDYSDHDVVVSDHPWAADLGIGQILQDLVPDIERASLRNFSAFCKEVTVKESIHHIEEQEHGSYRPKGNRP